MRLSSSGTVGRPLKSPRRREANVRAALLMLALFLAGMAVGAWWVYRSAKTPGTTVEDREQALAESTKAVLKNLKSPIEIQLYSLFGEGSSPAELSEFAGRVNGLLRTFRDEAGGKLRITKHEGWTEANSKRASAAGVVPFSVGDEPVYFGLVVAQDRQKETLAQVRPEWEAALEFDLARAIARVARPPSTPASAADQAMAERAEELVQRAIPNLGSVSLEEGKQLLRKAALEEYMTAVVEMEKEVKEAQQRLLKAESGTSDADLQAAREQLRKVQAKHAEKLSQITARSQAQIEALQRMKNQ